MAMQTINACFSSRREADLALETMTQEHGVDRHEIFVKSATDEKTAGTEVTGEYATAGEPGIRTWKCSKETGTQTARRSQERGIEHGYADNQCVLFLPAGG